MIKLLKVSALVLGTSLVVGCASTGDLEALQSDIDSLQAQTAAISAKADSAASDAGAAAANAAAAANRAADSAAETNQKLDRMLNKAMMK
ncbi:hypothetical protein BMR05_06385 [Methylococcaceae bacterium HT4]|uniref:Lpp/OprI family alanine-zipper lipoprotein n=1 Tax=Bathymodiolus platifrons methanotrophic gill symbiont TaxID=113268 RepID=UPI000B40D544|nr:Lpp/OprI family alanine-zipper lipoprotein [Bathymodiolus platifrons methanotrophic gill symbiont]MCK5870833.1 hypothetical protein [Methyloprofundus sp.]TXK93774.1 hypothetical protein BMR11_16295 [Methylococcaceae bacterium CS5]TXK96475.1 hypothetical protein BMR10_07730 [Methylococcaceae bacterium CS4]TXL06785.1 hypothetical protein BMR07_06330 [Methylococcaceae bacterium CS1]TXL07954.1 hypothetical protein BMR09_04015 [Methylococcaceae bacterium CS3]TXL11765.1 hypothetical protein BMR0